jgi:methylthioribose-1-phosphate isomerase
MAMEAILIEPRNENEMKVVKELIGKTDIPSFFIAEENKKKLAAIKMIEIASRHPKFDLSDEEIINMVKEDESDVYGKK